MFWIMRHREHAIYAFAACSTGAIACSTGALYWNGNILFNRRLDGSRDKNAPILFKCSLARPMTILTDLADQVMPNQVTAHTELNLH